MTRCPRVQHGAESIMRNVAKRMVHGELAQGVLAWRYNLADAHALARGERIMKRVGARWLNRALSDMYCAWREGWMADKNAARAERIMRRVGGRWRHKELWVAMSEWQRNARSGILEMVSTHVCAAMCV